MQQRNICLGRGGQGMKQLSLFSSSGQTRVLPKDGLEYSAGFIEQNKSDPLLHNLVQNVPCQQRLVKLYDREILTPGLAAWYGNTEGIDYGALGKSTPHPYLK
jgi:hypothetical protein